MPKTPRTRQVLMSYIESLLKAGDRLAEEIEDEVDVIAVTIIVRTSEGWGAHQSMGPESWGPREEAVMMVQAAQTAVEAVGGSMTLTVVDGEPRVRSMPRRNHRRGRPRR